MPFGQKFGPAVSPAVASVRSVVSHLPELGTDLVAALAGLKMNDLSHGCGGVGRISSIGCLVVYRLIDL